MSRRCKGNNVEEDNGVNEKEDDDEEKKKGSGCSYKRAKKVVVLPFNKLYKRYKTSSSNFHRNSCSMFAISSTRNRNYFGCLCMSKPQTLDPDYEGIDPNDPSVSFDYIKSLIEKNDFYSKECNTHVGI